MNIYLKLFLATGIPFGIMMGVFSLLSGHFQASYAIMTGLLAGLFFGGVESLFIGFFHSRAVKQISPVEPEKVMGVRHTRNIKLQLPYDETFDLCVDSVSLIRGCKIQKKDRTQGEIVARAGMTWESFGETILFSISKTNDRHTSIEISSKPALGTTLVDYGKNLWNVNTIIFFLTSHDKTARGKL